MSNSLAIAAVTKTLHQLIAQGVGEVSVISTKPPDKARTGNELPDQVNIFLYQTSFNAAWRNMDMPRQVRPGETGYPPLALNLHYLITAYGAEDDETKSQQWLGEAMSALHDHPVLSSQEIMGIGPESELHKQIERVRITPQPLSLEEMSKLWVIFQTQYRISAAYQVEVVLIESMRPPRMPLPVLTRGKDDSGVSAQGNLIPPFPTITDVKLIDPANSEFLSIKSRMSNELGDRLVIMGHHLAGVNADPNAVTVIVRFGNPRLTVPDVTVGAADRSDQQIIVRLPNQPADYPAGVYTMSIVVTPTGKDDQAQETNGWPVLIAPKLTSNLPMDAKRTNIVDDLGEVKIDLTCSPDVRPDQRVMLALGDRQVRPEPIFVQTNTLAFNVNQVRKGVFRLRLRVDGVDSHLIDFSKPEKPRFDDSMQITIHD